MAYRISTRVALLLTLVIGGCGGSADHGLPDAGGLPDYGPDGSMLSDGPMRRDGMPPDASLPSDAPTGPDASLPDTALPPATPTGFLVEAGDEEVVVRWNENDESDLAGYNVYWGTASGALDDSQFVHAPASSWTVSGLSNGTTYYFAIDAENAMGLRSARSAERSATPSERFLVEGNTLSGYGGQLVIGRKNFDPVTDALVTVNGESFDHVEDGSYRKYPLDTPVIIGDALELEILVAGETIEAMALVPESPVLSSPEHGSSHAADATVPIAWTSATNPDRFVVVATWPIDGGGTAARTSDVSGDLREFDFPADELPTDRAIAFAVNAHNDGEFSGPYLAGSTMNVRTAGTGTASVFLTTAGDPEAPATPDGFAVEVGSGEVTLTWTANQEAGLSHYNVYQATGSDPLMKIAEVPAGTELHVVTGLVNGTTYFFAVSAEVGSGLVSTHTTPIVAVPLTIQLSPVWVEQFGSSAFDLIYGLARAADGTVWAVGGVGGPFEGVTGAFVAQFDPDAGTRTSFAALGLNSVTAEGIALTADGGYVITGGAWSALPGQTQSGHNDAYVAKFDDAGSLLWARQLGDAGHFSYGRAVAVSASGDIYLAGYVTSGGALPEQTASGDSDDAFLAKYDASGARQWIRQFGTGNTPIRGRGLAVFDTEVVIMGHVASGMLPSSSSIGNVFVRRYTPNGEHVATTQVYGPGSLGQIVLDAEGRVCTAGFASYDAFEYGAHGQNDLTMFCVSPETGNISVAAQFGTSENDDGTAIALGEEGVVFVGGYTAGAFGDATNAGDQDAFIARLEP